MTRITIFYLFIFLLVDIILCFIHFFPDLMTTQVVLRGCKTGNFFYQQHITAPASCYCNIRTRLSRNYVIILVLQ